jgi:hypothetical protein
LSGTFVSAITEFRMSCVKRFEARIVSTAMAVAMCFPVAAAEPEAQGMRTIRVAVLHAYNVADEHYLPNAGYVSDPRTLAVSANLSF